MLVVFPFCAKDKALAITLAEWIRDLGGVEKHRCLLVCARSTTPDGVLEPLQAALGHVQLLVPPDDENGWPQGPNLLFRRAAQLIAHTIKTPWLWIETDAVPLCPSWVDDIEAGYAGCKRRYMGVRVEWPGVETHMSGVAVYPANTTQDAPALTTCYKAAFDVNAAGQTVPRMAITGLIQHDWRPASFDAAQDLTRIKPGVVLYHQCKDGSLIARLREIGGLSHEETTPALPTPETDSKPAGEATGTPLQPESAGLVTLAHLHDPNLWDGGTVATLAGILASYCTGGRRTEFVRRKLVEAGVISGPSPKKKAR